MRITLTSMFLLLFLHLTLAQNLDSVLNLVTEIYTEGDRHKAYGLINATLEKDKHIFESNPSLWAEYHKTRMTIAIVLDSIDDAEESLKLMTPLANNSSNDTAQAHAFAALAHYYHKTLKSKKAVEHIKKSIALYSNINDTDNVLKYKNLLAIRYVADGQTDTGIEIYQEIETFVKKNFKEGSLKSNSLLMKVYNGISTAYKKKGALSGSAKYLEKILTLDSLSIEDKATGMTNLSSILMYTNKLPEAIKMATDVLALKGVSNENRRLCLNTLIRSNLASFKFDTAEKALKQLHQETSPSNKFAVNLYQRRKAEYGIAKGDYKMAEEALEESLIFLKENSPNNLNTIHSTMVQLIEAKLGKYDAKDIMNDVNRLSLLQDSISRKRSQNEVIKYREQFESDKKEAENNYLNAENAKQKKFVTFGGIGLFFVSLLSFLFYNQREKLKKLNTNLHTQRDKIKLLNRELNHRVKNNLSFMTSLLEMQSRRSDTMETKQVLKESESRLKALSLVHSNLFQNDSDTEINLKSYLEEIINHLQDIFEVPDKSLLIRSTFEDYSIDAEEAMRIGLIINELVTNSVKHAFSDVDQPTIDIETTKIKDGKVFLKYKDNGPGIKETLISESLPKVSMGAKLIAILESQLNDCLVLQIQHRT